MDNVGCKIWSCSLDREHFKKRRLIISQALLIMLKLITLFELDALHILTSRRSEITHFSSLWRVLRSGAKLYQDARTWAFHPVAVKCCPHFPLVLDLFALCDFSPELVLGGWNHIVSTYIPSRAKCSVVHSR